MRQMIAKCLLLLAVLLMPFGMTPATAGPRDGPATAMRHCADQGETQHGNAGIAGCTMACAAALPACIVHPLEPREVVPPPHARASIKLLLSFRPDTKAPPPRQS